MMLKYYSMLVMQYANQSIQLFYYQFSEAVVQYDETNGVNEEIMHIFNDGTVRVMGSTMESRRKLWVNDRRDYKWGANSMQYRTALTQNNVH